MTRGSYSHRIVTGVAVTLLLGAGTALTACSDDSSEDSPSTTASAPATAGSTGAAPSGADTSAAPAPDAGDAGEGGTDPDGGQGGSAPVDPATAILGPDDAPAGFTVTGAQGTPDGDIAEAQQMLDVMTVTPPECKAVLQEQMAGGQVEVPGSASITYTDGGERVIAAGVAPAGSGQINDQCANLTAKADMGGTNLSISTATEDIAVNLTGVENQRAVRTTLTLDIAGQKVTVIQTMISGTVNGNDFSVNGSEGVDQAVLEGLAQTQADRLRG